MDEQVKFVLLPPCRISSYTSILLFIQLYFISSLCFRRRQCLYWKRYTLGYVEAVTLSTLTWVPVGFFSWTTGFCWPPVNGSLLSEHLICLITFLQSCNTWILEAKVNHIAFLVFHRDTWDTSDFYANEIFVVQNSLARVNFCIFTRIICTEE